MSAEIEVNPKVFKGRKPYLVDNDRLISSKNFRLFSSDLDLSLNEFLATIEHRFVNRLVSFSGLLSRIGRFGIHQLLKSSGGDLIAVKKGEICQFDANTGQFRPVFTDFQGSRPLRSAITPNGTIFFGEYFGNAERSKVSIFSSANIKDWKEVWSFQPGEIRHVHGIHWDPFRKGLWITTGDSDEESGIWFTDNNFKTLDRVLHGSQMSRAVQIIVTEEGLIIPSDTPLEPNFIQYYDFRSEQLKKICSIPGSAFHAVAACGMYFVSTVTEPSAMNDLSASHLYGSINGQNWKKIKSFSRDLFPVRLQKYTRYAELELVPSGENSEKFFTYGRALKNYDHTLMMWDASELRNFLSK